MKILVIGLDAATMELIEPWVAVATAVGLLCGKLRRKASRGPHDQMAPEIMDLRRQVLAAATWLLGICVIIIVALKMTDQNARTWADEQEQGFQPTASRM